MKIEYHILSVEMTGDQLRIKAQGVSKSAAEWRPMSVLDFTIPDNPTNARTYHVGRTFKITVTPS